MKKLEAFGEGFEAERIVKTADSIIGYNGQAEVFAFRGITDFSLFVIDGEYDQPQEDSLSVRLATAEAETAALNLAIIDIWEMLASTQ